MTQQQIDNLVLLSGLPTNVVETFANVVIQSQRTGGIQISPWTKRNSMGQVIDSGYRVTRSSRTSANYNYALTLLASYVHEFNFEYVGESNGVFTFEKPDVTFTLLGQLHFIPGQTLTIYQLFGKWIFAVTSQQDEFKVRVNRQLVTLTAEQVAAYAKVPVDTLWSWDTDEFHGVERPEDGNINNIFVHIATGSENAAVFINGEVFSGDGYGSLRTASGATGRDYVVRWKLYNDCTPQTATSGGYEAGNFGLCELRGPLPSGNEQLPQEFNADLTREFAVLECQIEELPAQGKNFTVSGYLDLKTGEKLYRLPRKTGEGVVFA